MRRVAIIGVSGSGKTTLAGILAERLGVEHIELDAIHHGPDWTEMPAEQFRQVVGERLGAADGWVVDAMYHQKLGEMVLLLADTVVWLDLPMRTWLWRLVRRTGGRLWRREELWNGNRESLRGAFFGRDALVVWAMRRHVEYRRTLAGQFAQPRYDDVTVVRLRSPDAVRRWLATARDS
jgi:adenylate kinase family enzyme